MIEIINVLGIAFLISNYPNLMDELDTVFNYPKYIFKIPLIIGRCLMCCSFWVSLIYTGGDIPLSGFISLIAFCIDKYLISTPIKL
tara:strand:- start:829 stop:1086 length:258 start_codon:yes stop_codon:yes gene_type:complete